jgi:hypothetical protein
VWAASVGAIGDHDQRARGTTVRIVWALVRLFVVTFVLGAA